MAGIRSGEVAELMGWIDSEADLAEVESWYLREYYLSGGHPMWFGSIVRATVKGHRARIQHTTLAKLRLPAPGGRYYVMVDAVGGRKVLRGEICLDPET